MKKLQAYSLLAIAVILFANLFVKRIWPVFYFHAKRDTYYELTVACKNAVSAYRHSETQSIGLEEIIQERLLLAAHVELVVCHDYQYLRNKLLVHGVSPARLNTTDLEATADQDVPLEYVEIPAGMQER